jgi:protein-L-isoaspartate(D-aspartate) O-methyltransferase
MKNAPVESLDFPEERNRMVEKQIRQRGLVDSRLLSAFERVPRHLFVPEYDRDFAYEDAPLYIGCGQTISQPYVVALMTDLLNLRGEETILEVGTGSGYQAAILALMAKEVHTIEFLPELASRASRLLARYVNVHCHTGDGSLGLPEFAPYDAIAVTAAAPKVPPALLEQLKDGGRMVIPVGGIGYQVLEVWTRHGNDYACRSELAVAFVSMRGQYGQSGV